MQFSNIVSLGRGGCSPRPLSFVTSTVYKAKKQTIQSMVCQWQPKKDSNPHKQSQSLSCYLYTIRLFIRLLSALLLTKYIISNPKENVNT